MVAESQDLATAMPTTIRELIAARLDALPARERDVLLDAAVVGRVFWRGALERMAKDPVVIADVRAGIERRELVRIQAISAVEGEEE